MLLLLVAVLSAAFTSFLISDGVTMFIEACPVQVLPFRYRHRAADAPRKREMSRYTDLFRSLMSQIAYITRENAVYVGEMLVVNRIYPL